MEATTQDSGTALRAPTLEAGLAPACRDTCFAVLKLQIWERRYDGSKGKVHYFSHLNCFSSYSTILIMVMITSIISVIVTIIIVVVMVIVLFTICYNKYFSLHLIS